MSSLRTRKPPFDDEVAKQTITTIFDRLFDLPDGALRTDVPNTLAPADYTLAYSTAYEWVTCGIYKATTPPDPLKPMKFGIFDFLEDYFTHSCIKLRDRLASLGMGSTELTHAYVSLYSNYHRRAAAAGRIFANAEKSLMRDARRIGVIWLKCPFPPPSQLWKSSWVETTDEPDSQQTLSAQIPEPQNRDEWVKHLNVLERQALVADWELPEEAKKGNTEWSSAVTRAEAGQDPVEAPFVRVMSIALRRWRLHVLELLADRISTNTENMDAQVATALAQSVRDVGWHKDDNRRKHIESLLPRPQ